MGCGIKRLFDEKAFRSYGPYSYDLQRLMAWERAHRVKAIWPRSCFPATIRLLASQLRIPTNQQGYSGLPALQY